MAILVCWRRDANVHEGEALGCDVLEVAVYDCSKHILALSTLLLGMKRRRINVFDEHAASSGGGSRRPVLVHVHAKEDYLCP